MQPSAATQYVLSPTDGWVPWAGSSTGSGNVVLYTVGGAPISTATNSDDEAPTFMLDVAGYNYVLSGATWDRVRALPSDTDAQVAAQDGLQGGVSRLQGYNGATWDRLRTYGANADNLTAPTLGLLGVYSFLAVYDGTNYDRVNSLPSDTDDQVAAQVGLLGTVARGQIFDGTTWDRKRSASAANIAAQTGAGAQIVSGPGDWSIAHTPGAATQATITRAAVASTRHVCTSISATLSNPPASDAGNRMIQLRDGATGAGTILWAQTMRTGGGATTFGNSIVINISGLNIVGSVNTAMTLEFDSAPSANCLEAVALTGHDVV